MYWVYRSSGPVKVTGRVVGETDTGILLKRDRPLIGNVGMYEIDTVPITNILAAANE